ncbi:MAG: molybdopterin synthase catalytic subunit [Actinomycetota bacterium]
MAEIEVALSAEALDIGAALDAVASPACGAIASFIGTVREEPSVPANAERRVIALEYDAHPEIATRRLQEIADEACAKWDVRHLVAIHRVGLCPLGIPTVLIACSAPHRADALEACRWTIDELKASVPIWKKEIYEEGHAWVGNEVQAAPQSQAEEG